MSWRNHLIHEARSSLTIWRRKARHFFWTGAVLRNSAARGTKWSMVCVFLHLPCPAFCPTPGQQSGVGNFLKNHNNPVPCPRLCPSLGLSLVSGTICRDKVCICNSLGGHNCP